MATQIADYSSQKKSGCGILGFYNGVFGGGRRPRRTSSTSSIPIPKLNTFNNSKQIRRGGSDVTCLLDTSSLAREDKEMPTIVEATNSMAPKTSPPHFRKTVTTSSSSSTGSSKTSKVTPIGRRHSTTWADLDSMRTDYQRMKGSTTLVTSSSAMPLSHLGNIMQPSNSSNISSITATNALDNRKHISNGNCIVSGSVVMGNIGRGYEETQMYGNLCKTMSRALNPEELKVMGNNEYKKGRFAEALALYDRAIALNPNKASYRSNKSAALTCVGRLLEAIFECREAVKAEPFYHRAHHRLATLYLRLGEANKALSHLKQSGPEAEQFEIVRAELVRSHVDKCNEARKAKDWTTLLKETKSAISLGADSALQIFSLEAEALLKLHRHEDADTVVRNGPHFDIDHCTKFFGPNGNAQILAVRAQIDMAAGRFEEAVGASQQAVQLDSSNKEVSSMLRMTRAVATARSTGNNLYNTCKFSEASVAYTQGLEHQPFNSILLCNRAACRFKLGQFEKAVEDCTNALNLRPSYIKARLRRADCNAKMERWEASIQDYEMLIRETPGDQEVGRALFEAQVQLKKERGEDVTGMKFRSDVVIITNNERFRHYVTSPGMSVVLFSNKSSDKQAVHYMGQLSKRYPSVNFLKVVVEEHPYLAKSEGLRSVPAFKIYKNGSRVKDIPGESFDLLESSVKFCSN